MQHPPQHAAGVATGTRSQPTRRTVAAGAAWAVPAIVTAATTPTVAASTAEPCTVYLSLNGDCAGLADAWGCLFFNVIDAGGRVVFSTGVACGNLPVTGLPDGSYTLILGATPSANVAELIPLCGSAAGCTTYLSLPFTLPSACGVIPLALSANCNA